MAGCLTKPIKPSELRAALLLALAEEVKSGRPGG